MPWWGVLLIAIGGLLTGGLAVFAWFVWYFSRVRW